MNESILFYLNNFNQKKVAHFKNINMHSLLADAKFTFGLVAFAWKLLK